MTRRGVLYAFLIGVYVGVAGWEFGWSPLGAAAVAALLITYPYYERVERDR